MKVESVTTQKPEIQQAIAAEIIGEDNGFTAVAKRALLATVSIKCKENDRVTEQGTGFIVGGYVVTNAHVVAKHSEKREITAAFDASVDKTEYMLSVVEADFSHDVAICKFTGLAARNITEKNCLGLKLSLPRLGEDVFTIGNPFGAGLALTRGVVSNPDRKVDFLDVDSVIHTDINAHSGSSGGALIDMNGKVLGIITFVYENGSGMSYAVPCSQMMSLIRKHIKECDFQ